MNGFSLAQAVATSINAATFALTPNASAKIAPQIDAKALTTSGNVLTTVLWVGQRREHQTKTNVAKVVSIDVAVQRRCVTANGTVDTAKFSELADLVDAIEAHLYTAEIDGVLRRHTFVSTDAPIIYKHLADHKIATRVITIEYEEAVAI